MLGYVMDKLIFSDEIILTFKKFTIYLSQVKLSFILFLCGMDFLASLQVFMIYFYLLVIFLFAIWGFIAGSKRSVGKIGGLVLGLFLNIVGIIIIYLTKKVDKNAHINLKSLSAIDELKKYKELLDKGAITEQEYNIQKGRILNH